MKKAFVILIVLALAGAGLYYKHFGKNPISFTIRRRFPAVRSALT